MSKDTKKVVEDQIADVTFREGPKDSQIKAFARVYWKNNGVMTSNDGTKLFESTREQGTFYARVPSIMTGVDEKTKAKQYRDEPILDSKLQNDMLCDIIAERYAASLSKPKK